MRVGTLCYATDQGLGILAKSFYDHGVVTDVMVVRHGRHETHDEWYPGSKQISDLRSPTQREEAVDFCREMDAMLFFETPFIWTLVPYCRQLGVKTALMPMYECMPANLPYVPDLFINPSHLDQDYYPSGVHIPVPVEYPWRLRKKAEVFIHNAGHGGLKGRNGTAELLEAIQHVKSAAKIIVRSQNQLLGVTADKRLDRVQFEFGNFEYHKMFSNGDVFVFPEKFNGLSLPLQEARAAGMLVMCGDRHPMNKWLLKCERCKARNKCMFFCDPGPCEVCGSPYRGVGEYRNPCPLIPVESYQKNKIGPPYNAFDEAIFDPRTIAVWIDEWYGRDIREYSEQGREWAKTRSWEALKPRYVEALEKLVG